MLSNGDFIYYRGHEMHRIDEKGHALRKDRWYFEPKEWASKYSFSPGYLTIREALAAANEVLKDK